MTDLPFDDFDDFDFELDGPPPGGRRRYEYDRVTTMEAEHAIEQAIPAPVRLERAALEADFGGVDVIYRLNGGTGLQLRCRFDRPVDYAAEVDVTFRDTEPAMIAAGTYAPLMLFLWFRGGYVEAGRLIDVYQMNRTLRVPLRDRERIPNGDGTFFIRVDVAELIARNSRSLLRVGDRRGWADFRVGASELLSAMLGNGRRR